MACAKVLSGVVAIFLSKRKTKEVETARSVYCWDAGSFPIWVFGESLSLELREIEN